MSAAATIEREDTVRVLRQACQRNTPAELHFPHEGAGLITARVRMLRIEEDQIYVDRPQAGGSPLSLDPGRSVTVHFLVGGTRYAFDSRIRRPHCLVQLNASQQIAGTALAIPAEVRQQQRRADFRLSLAGYEGVVAKIHAGVREGGGSCAIDARVVSARLVNISTGGLGVLLDTSATAGWRVGAVFFMSFSLPEVEVEFCMMTELRHLERIHEGASTVAGFIFLPWELCPLQPYARRISRFIATEQRKQLRRNR
jgi:c-di-GMP-binding flagellar brake protein YcgR